MKRPLLSGLLRLAAFSLLFLLVLVAADFFLVDTDSVAALTIREMQQADDIELAVVGSSVVRDHFNQQMIREKTGLSSFSVTAPGAGFPPTPIRILVNSSSPRCRMMFLSPLCPPALPFFRIRRWPTGRSISSDMTIR